MILKKIKSAVTDSEGKVYYSRKNPESTTLSIYSACGSFL